MAILEAVHYFTTTTISLILSLILYLRFTTANVKLPAGQHFSWDVNCELVNGVMNTNWHIIRCYLRCYLFFIKWPTVKAASTTTVRAAIPTPALKYMCVTLPLMSLNTSAWLTALHSLIQTAMACIPWCHAALFHVKWLLVFTFLLILPLFPVNHND